MSGHSYPGGQEVGHEIFAPPTAAREEELDAMKQRTPLVIDDLLADRSKRYGAFSDHAMVTQELKAVVSGTKGWISGLNDSQREAIDMIFHKIGRIVCGDPYYKDSWTDIIGYARLVEKELD